MNRLAKAALIAATSGMVLVGGALPAIAAPTNATTNSVTTQATTSHIETADLPVVDPYIASHATAETHAVGAELPLAPIGTTHSEPPAIC